MFFGFSGGKTQQIWVSQKIHFRAFCVPATSLPGLSGPEFCNIFVISIALDKIESDSRLQCYIGDLRGILSLGVAHIVCTLFPKASKARSVSVAFSQLFLFPLH